MKARLELWCKEQSTAQQLETRFKTTKVMKPFLFSEFSIAAGNF